MEAVLKAAQWDPVKNGNEATPDAQASVLSVERALSDVGLLDKRFVDGHFGTATVKAYSAWQTRMGYSGTGANGLPGPATLKKLSEGHFALTNVIDPGPRVTYQGYPFSTRTRRMLEAAQSLSGMKFSVTQGSYSAGKDSTSKGTHDGGGAVDIGAESLSPQDRIRVVSALRKVGFAAWVRNPGQGGWPWHIHAIAISDPDLSKEAQNQVGRYYEGRDGLAANGPDDGPQLPRVTFEEYLRSKGQLS